MFGNCGFRDVYFFCGISEVVLVNDCGKGFYFC